MAEFLELVRDNPRQVRKFFVALGTVVALAVAEGVIDHWSAQAFLSVLGVYGVYRVPND